MNPADTFILILCVGIIFLLLLIVNATGADDDQLDNEINDWFNEPPYDERYEDDPYDDID